MALTGSIDGKGSVPLRYDMISVLLQLYPLCLAFVTGSKRYISIRF